MNPICTDGLEAVKLPAEKQAFYDDIFAPRATGVPPADAVRDMMVTPDGEIRHYGWGCLGNERRRVCVYSRDLGLSWETRLAAADDPDDFSQRLQLPWEAMEPRPPIMLKHGRPGRLVMPCSNVNHGNNCYKAACLFSDDGGASWSRADVPETPGVARQTKWDRRPHWFNDGCEPSVAELSDGTLLMALRTSGPHLVFSRSRDSGATWSVPEADVRFWQANTMPTLLKLRDGRLLLFWNNTEMLPTRDLSEYPELGADERSGKWETVFTNRDAIHAAISEDDGKTWIGFRELFLNPFRNEADFRELGNSPELSHDKSVHQSQAIELPGGKVLVAFGQNVPRRFVIFDPQWLYGRSRETDFRQGIGDLSSHLYVKSLSGGWRGWAGHCAWNRAPGPFMEKDPFEPGSNREYLHLCRIDDPRLVCARQGIVWNFPASARGRLEIECRIEGEGFRVSLLDHWVNPCDERSGEVAVRNVDVTRETLGAGWRKLTLEWDIPGGQVSYVHIQTLAGAADHKGAYFRSLKAEAVPCRGTDWMRGKVGAFVHFLVDEDGFRRLGEFDVEGLVGQLKEMKADYFILTLGQNSGWYCAPNATYEKLAGYAPYSRCSRRDIPAEIIAALKGTGIRFGLYLPCQTPNRDQAAARKFGFPAEEGNIRDYPFTDDGSANWAKVIEEWSRRYGRDVSIWWFDGGYSWCGFGDAHAAKYKAAVLAGNPDAAFAFNPGVRMERNEESGNYWAGEENEPFDVIPDSRWKYPGVQWQVLTFMGRSWGDPECRFPDEAWRKWIKAATEKGGAVTIDMNISRPFGKIRPEQVAQFGRIVSAKAEAGF